MIRDEGRRIFKYQLPIEDCTEIDMPKGAKVLCVQVQNEQPFLWAEVLPESGLMKLRRFYVIGTGHPMPVLAKRYIGTFQLVNESFIGHVYE
jgi:hypothetical protein